MLDTIKDSIFLNEDLISNRETSSSNINEESNGMEQTIAEVQFNIANVTSDEAKEFLARQLVEAIVIGEIEFLDQNCKQAGIQLAVHEAFTRRFDEKTKLKTPLLVTYYIESVLLEDDANSKKITVPTQRGLAYKEEMALQILQIKYQMMLKSGKYDSKGPEMIKVKKKLMEFYKRHCNRLEKADKVYLKSIRQKLAEETEGEKSKSIRAVYLKKEENRIQNRIEQRVH